MSKVIELHKHERAKIAAAAGAARRLAKRLQLSESVTEKLADTASALVRRGCSTAWAISVAQRCARRARREIGVQR